MTAARAKTLTVVLGLQLLLLVVAAPAVALPGELDVSFAGDGTRLVENVDLLYEAADVLVQPDGKIVVAGFRSTGGDEDFAIARLHPDGSLDASFDGDGVGSVNFGGDDFGWAVALQRDGRIVVAGETRTRDGGDGAVARLRPNGALDTSFAAGGPDGDGRRIIGDVGVDAPKDVLVQPDGKLVIAGSGGTVGALAVTRLEPNGADDLSFDGDGTAALGDTTFGHSVVLQPAGKVVVAGRTAVREDVLVARFNPTGPTDSTLDLSFGLFGTRIFGYGGGDVAREVLVQPDGKLVTAGSGGPDTALAVTRLDPDGQLFDNSFDGDGTGHADFGGAENGEAALLQPNGKIVVVGSTSLNQDIAVARFNPTGPPDATLDTTFSADGKTTIDLGRAEHAFAAALQADGKIVIAGSSSSGALVARLHGDRPSDPGSARPGGGSRGGPGGGSGGGPGPGGGDEGGDPAPRISRLSLTRARFAATGRRRGTRIRFTLSEAADVIVTIERAGAGRRVRGTCRPAKRSNRRARRCTSWRRAGRMRFAGRQGANSTRFSGRIQGRPLRAGRYRLRLIAVDASTQRSKQRTARFTVRRPRIEGL